MITITRRSQQSSESRRCACPQNLHASCHIGKLHRHCFLNAEMTECCLLGCRPPQVVHHHSILWWAGGCMRGSCRCGSSKPLRRRAAGRRLLRLPGLPEKLHERLQEVRQQDASRLLFLPVCLAFSEFFVLLCQDYS